MTLPTNARLELYLDDTLVGAVVVKGNHHAWFFGEFFPNEGFAKYANLFGRWSLLMHADEDSDRLTTAASDELRRTEIEIDRLRVKLRDLTTGHWRRAIQVNIDGEMVDWKE